METRSILYLGLILALLITVQGCATVGRAIGSGAGAGALFGGGIGALADPGRRGQNRIRNILIGTAIGGAVGAGSGYLTHRLTQNEAESSYKDAKDVGKKEEFERSTNSSENTPNLIPPRTEAVWVPDLVRGQTFIPGHFEYRIIEGAHWEVQR